MASADLAYRGDRRSARVTAAENGPSAVSSTSDDLRSLAESVRAVVDSVFWSPLFDPDRRVSEVPGTGISPLATDPAG
ncbi:hypothetical protein CHR55_31845 [Rhodococcus qingshengii]|uniref:Uncharacterized protein n=1 Tax=Rhodococcus qingshengii TaxID=334542 RepID=A0A2A5IZA0_RHOSG|nr:hypothetical protein CHR55_31845 [Rhodococcus qingshengii]